MKKETFNYYNVVAVLNRKVIVVDTHDLVLFVKYNQFGDIEGLNFHYGTDVVDEQFQEPCPHVTELFKRVSSDNSPHKNKSEKKRMLLAVKLFTKAFIVGTI